MLDSQFMFPCWGPAALQLIDPSNWLQSPSADGLIPDGRDVLPVGKGVLPEGKGVFPVPNSQPGGMVKPSLLVDCVVGML